MTQGQAISILKTGANVFLTGEPGSGKTHTVNEYVAWLKSCGIEPSVTAATGIAATHISGMTLHSWSGIGVMENPSPADIDWIASKEYVAKRIAKAKVLIIDEISMLSAGTFAAADAVCREVRHDTRPFGGITVLLVGDFFQLPPVSKNGRASGFAYQSATWRELNPVTCYLTGQYRQDDDEFLGVLSAIRAGEVEELHFECLSSRQVLSSAAPQGAPKLFSHNADVDRINADELAKLPGAAKRFHMTSKGKGSVVENLKRGCLSPEVLELKEGAKVMFTKNSPQGKFVNGTLGTVIGFERGTSMPIIEAKSGSRITAEPMEWQVEEQGKVRASVSQVPLRLAYAMTVHKSQGMSMDEAVIDLSRAFEYGQGYVALSRVRRLSGVHLLGMNARALEVHPEILEKDRQFRTSSDAAELAFFDMPAAELEELQKNFVKANGGAWTTEKSAKHEARNSKRARGGAAAAGFIPGRLAETLQCVRDTGSLAAAAKARGLTVSTVVHHLEELRDLDLLERADYAHILPRADDLAAIRDALRESDEERLSPAFHALGGRHSFEELRLVRLSMRA